MYTYSDLYAGVALMVAVRVMEGGGGRGVSDSPSRDSQHHPSARCYCLLPLGSAPELLPHWTSRSAFTQATATRAHKPLPPEQNALPVLLRLDEQERLLGALEGPRARQRQPVVPVEVVVVVPAARTQARTHTHTHKHVHVHKHTRTQRRRWFATVGRDRSAKQATRAPALPH